ncbi:hypothetical protein [Leptospirillum ferriphilum]|uniref:hypothetical protein n=1 Tax=Leptospirillum ferriphilum TaxID=178606 RepID=UPI000986A12B|nr:hypothetical protein [Leptospirillum ferriphilum]OOH76229.1 hypothetical protein BOX30_11085 [Leptospirillum ferriphilum]
MTRELVRRVCGHLQTVYLFGKSDRWIDREIRKREKELCGVCRDRRVFEASMKEDPDDRPEERIEIRMNPERQGEQNDS